MEDERTLQVHPIPQRLRDELRELQPEIVDRSAQGGGDDTEVLVSAHIFRIADPVPPFAESDSLLASALPRPVSSWKKSRIHKPVSNNRPTNVKNEKIVQKDSNGTKIVEVAVFLDQAAYANHMKYLDQDSRALLHLLLAYFNAVINNPIKSRHFLKFNLINICNQ